MATITDLDLNLLVHLQTLLAERSVSRAAERLGLSQSATSHALGRLRRLLGDELLVRVGNEMRPTAKARSLEEPLAEVLRGVEHLLEPAESLRPERIDRTFRILAGDVSQVRLVPRLLRRLAAEAPAARLDVHDLSGIDPIGRLASGDVDLAIFYALDLELPHSVVQEPLFTDRHVCVVRRELDVGERLDWAGYAELGHVVCLPRGSEYPLTRGLDRAFERRGLRRRRCLTVSGGLLIAAALLDSDYVATISETEARFLCRWFPLRLVEPPFRDTELVESMVWDRRFGADPAHQWLRGLLHTVATTAASEEPASSPS